MTVIIRTIGRAWVVNERGLGSLEVEGVGLGGDGVRVRAGANVRLRDGFSDDFRDGFELVHQSLDERAARVRRIHLELRPQTLGRTVFVAGGGA